MLWVSYRNHVVAAVQVASHLEEMLTLAKASEQYSQYMMGGMQEAVAPAPLDPSVEQVFRSGQFSVTIRELIAYYIAMVSSTHASAMCITLSVLHSCQCTAQAAAPPCNIASSPQGSVAGRRMMQELAVLRTTFVISRWSKPSAACCAWRCCA